MNQTKIKDFSTLKCCSESWPLFTTTNDEEEDCYCCHQSSGLHFTGEHTHSEAPRQGLKTLSSSLENAQHEA